VYVEKKQKSIFVDNQSSQRLTDLLAESEKAIQEAKPQRAYKLAVQATQVVPESIEAWLLRATLAPSLDERILAVNRLNELAPGYQDKYNLAFYALKESLDRDPFLRYLEETDELYRVVNAQRVVLSIPKKRAPVNSPSPDQAPPGPLKGAYRWLTMAILGLLLAGIGAVIFAPITAFVTLRAQDSLQSRAERLSSTVILIVAFGLFVIGVLFSILFLLHWLG
jgi:hypothetical protein